MQNGFFKAALLAGVLAFTMPAAFQAQAEDTTATPSANGPDVNTTTAGQDAAAAPATDEEGCPAGSLGTDESAAPTDGTAAGTDADLTNCAEKEPSDQPAATEGGAEGSQDGGDAEGTGTNQQGSDDAGTNTGG